MRPMIAFALEALAPERRRLDALVEREILRLRARYALSFDELRGLYISDTQVDALLAPDATSSGPAPEAQEAASVLAAARHAYRASPFGQLVRALQLDDVARDVVFACLAPDLDTKYGTLFAYLNNDLARPWATPELAARLFGDSAAQRVAICGLFAPEGLLASAGILASVMPARDVPATQRGFRVTPAIAAWVQGLPYVDERLAGIACPVVDGASGAIDVFEAPVRERVSQIAGMLARRDVLPPIAVTSASAADAAIVAQDMCAIAGRPALTIDLAALAAHTTPSDALAAALTMQRVLGVALVAAPMASLSDAEGRPIEGVLAPLRRLAARASTLVLAGADDTHWREAFPEVPIVELRLGTPDVPGRARAWREAIGGDATALPFDALADRFALGPVRIRLAAATAWHAARIAGQRQPSAAQLFEAARAISLEGAGDTTRTIETRMTWEDLVVPPDVQRRLADLLGAIEQRVRVLDEWGFSARVGGKRGIKVMFAGPSGTGKTMAAGIIAGRLQLDLQRVEFSAVMSKYIGETEKNLDRAFAAARRANAMLFIDEADALLGKRSEVKDAHDRYANVETAYLLQKMEDHDGVVVLATNLAKNIDEAFSRRMQFIIEFPMPDAASRERLWRGMFPAGAPLSPAVDFGFLARQFVLAGGDIRNIALDAAFRAARDGTQIDLAQVLRAVARQYAKRGQVPTAEDFREHFDLLAAEAPDTAAAPLVYRRA